MTNKIDDLDLSLTIHFIGIGGCGMAAIAATLRSVGYAISGSDISDSNRTRELREAGCLVSIGHNGGNIPGNTQLVVISAAVKPENPEYAAARTRGIPIIKYAQMLGMLMRTRTGVAIAGTHGKTTTSAMVALAMRQLGLDPGFVIGGEVPQLGGGAGVGSSDFLVAEACEFDRSFLSLHPRYATINNIEEDHLDYYRDLDEIIGAFRDFALRIPPDGVLVYGASSINTARFIHEVPCHTVACALDHPADYWADDIHFRNQKTTFRLHKGHDPEAAEAESCDVQLQTFGRHNIINALQAIALIHQIGLSRKIDLPLESIASAVASFRGVHRRFEIIHNDNAITIVDDYAHHPTAIQTVLKSSRRFFYKRRLVVVFQPHQHSRTRFLMQDFARSFSHADLAIVPDIYFVRDSEKERELVHARDLVRQIVANGGNAVYIPSFAEIETFLQNNLHEGDVLLTMGAGNVWQIGANLARKYQNRKL